MQAYIDTFRVTVNVLMARQ